MGTFGFTGEGIVSIRIRLFGTGIAVTENDREVSLEYAVTTKVMQLWVSILTAGREGIARGVLLERLYGREEQEDAGASLRVNLHRLRKSLRKMECFGDADCILSKSGRFYWNWDVVPVELDTELFERSLEQAAAETDMEGRIAALIRACDSYHGDFLPELAGEEWVATACARYQKEYLSGIQEIGTYLEEQKRFEELCSVAERACQVYPDEEFYLLWIDCLMGMERYKDALRIYEKAAAFYMKELGLTPSPELMVRFRKMSDKIDYRIPVMDEIKKELYAGTEETGVYYCSYPGFIDCYHTVCRTLERYGLPAFLLLSTVTGKDGKVLNDKEKLQDCMDTLKEVIRGTLRKSDFFTQLGDDQYLILLVGMQKENRVLIQNRINKNMEKTAQAGKCLLTYRIFPAIGQPEE